MASPSLPVAITRGEKKWTVTYARGEEVAVEEGATHANRGLVLTRVRAVSRRRFFSLLLKWSGAPLEWDFNGNESYRLIFFFAYPSSLVVEPLCVWDFTATYTPTFASLLLRRKRRSAGGVPCFSYRPQTLLTSIFYPKASYSEQSHDNTWVTALPCVTRSSIMINMPCWIVVLHSKAPTEDFKWRFNCLLWHHHLN